MIQKYEIDKMICYDKYPFTKKSVPYPKSDSFFISFGVGLLENFVRLDCEKILNVSWNVLRTELSNLRMVIKGLNSSTGIASLNIMNKLLNEISTKDTKEGLEYLYEQISSEKILYAISEIFKIITFKYCPSLKAEIFNNFKMNRDYFKFFCRRFHVFLMIHEDSGCTNYNSAEVPKGYMPAIHLLKSNSEINENYCILYHYEVIRSFEKYEKPNPVYPYVWEPDYMDTIAKEKEDFIENNKLGSKSSSKKKFFKEDNKRIEEQPADKHNEYKQYSNALIDAVSEILLESNLTAKDTQEILELYSESKFYSRNIELVKELHRNRGDRCYSLMDLLGAKDFVCINCKKKSEIPIKISCETHNTCINCRLKYFKTGFCSNCPICYREMLDNELQILNILNPDY
jgi:hypothetical protein